MSSLKNGSEVLAIPQNTVFFPVGDLQRVTAAECQFDPKFIAAVSLTGYETDSDASS